MTFDLAKMMKLMHFILHFHYMKMAHMTKNYIREIKEAYTICFGESDEDDEAGGDESKKVQTKISDFFKLENPKDL